jgi:hypothetical protein
MLNWSELLDIELRNTGNADVALLLSETHSAYDTIRAVLAVQEKEGLAGSPGIDDALAGVYLEPR